MAEASPASDTSVDVSAAQPETPAATEATSAGVNSTDVSTTAESSTADGKGSEKPVSVLDAVQKALAQPTTDGSSPNPEGSSEENAASDDNADLPDEISAEELNSYHSKTRKRVKQLVDRAKRAEAIAQQSEQGARQWDAVQTFVLNAGLTKDEVNAGFEIMRLMKNDPEVALQKLMPFVGMLQEATGLVLPPALRQRVEQGYVDEETARQLSRQQARQALQMEASTRAAQEAETRLATERLNGFVHQVGSTVAEWEKKWSASDPDYKVKQPHVMLEIENRLLKNGAPQTVQGAIQLADDARKAVEERLRPLQQRKREIIPVTPGSSISAAAKPKSLLEAMTLAVKG